jgi:hypothetical protein
MMGGVVLADGSGQQAAQVVWIWATVVKIWARSATCQKTIIVHPYLGWAD